jgi:hypothetical protein
MYTVHVRTPAERLDRDIVLVKEGFSWPAFFFSVIWALWSRLWWVALALFVVEVGWAVIADTMQPIASSLIGAGLAVIVGYLANDLKRWTLFRRGYVEMGVVGGADSDAALQRFFDRHAQLAQGILR